MLGDIKDVPDEFRKFIQVDGCLIFIIALDHRIYAIDAVENKMRIHL